MQGWKCPKCGKTVYASHVCYYCDYDPDEED